MGARTAWLVLGALALSSCELAEVAAPAGADVLVVEAVLRAGRGRQYVMLHRSIEGSVVRGEPKASVAVTTDSGMRVRFEETDIRNCLTGSPDDWDFEQEI